MFGSISKTFPLLRTLVISFHVSHFSSDSCGAMSELRRRAAFDIGSGATKLMIADVDGSSVAKDYSNGLMRLTTYVHRL